MRYHYAPMSCESNVNMLERLNDNMAKLLECMERMRDEIVVKRRIFIEEYHAACGSCGTISPKRRI